MAEATAPTTTRKPAAKRAPAPKKAAAPAAAEVSATGYVLEAAGNTKTYAKFTFPEGSGCVGTVYAPLGTKTVKVRLES